MHNRLATALLCLCFTLPAQADSTKPNIKFNGYIEAELTYLSAPASGWLQKLNMQAGDTVQKGASIFSLDTESQQIALQQARAQLAQAKANLADLQTGARPDEIAAIQAQILEAKAVLKLAESEKNRWSLLAKQNQASQSQKDQADEAWQAAQAKLANLEASLHLATLGAREQQIAAANAQVDIAHTNIAQAQWQLSQRQVTAPITGTVEQVYQRLGEYIQANRPVLSLTNPQHLKAIFYIPQNALSHLHVGQKVWVTWDGSNQAETAKIRFIAQTSEFTPPVIFSETSRQKLVYKVEAQLLNSQLRPGQPVDISIENPDD